MTVYAKTPEQETVPYEELDYVTASIIKTDEDAELDLESKDGFVKKEELTIFRKCDQCGADDTEEGVELYNIRSLGSDGVESCHACKECLDNSTVEAVS